MGAACCKGEPIDFQAEVELNHFELLRSVGKGAFGKVRIVQHKQTKQTYALKYINKEKCINMKAVDNIIQERRLLEEIHSPFVCNLRFAFQDDENLFMVLDLMLGGDLRFHLDRLGSLKEDMVKFYTAEIAAGLSYLHSKKIVHRDLKPDNVLLDENGHATLTDFNIAVRYRDEKPLTAVAGSMAYMAPEVLSRKGYFNAIDWWSLGVVAYELIFGQRPFRGKTNEELTQSILEDHISIPNTTTAGPVSKECISMLQGLMKRPLEERLGAKESGGDIRIKNHEWFKDWDWAKVEAREIPVPFTPDSKRANFDATHELEELLLEDNPLKVKPRKRKSAGGGEAPPDETPFERDMRILEEKFTVFDFTKPKTQTTGPGRGNSQMNIKGSNNAINKVGTTGGAEPVRTREDSIVFDPWEGRADGVKVDGLEGDKDKEKDKAGA
ncbi:hypothetical protein HDU76_000955 [Blyttiomyces sp. JEL0837]|nr:hypothetical protein HDU76_000955 [Blyttiomyces sp. JEL0837]